jgi:PTH1 family peptidyl-tRNA hydrolase
MFGRPQVQETGDLYLVAGLGNPGKEYEGTRHNVGFEVVRMLAARRHASLARSRFRADMAEIRIGESKVLLACPITFMNNSGESIAAICRFYKIDPGNVMVVLDDVAIPVGRLRLRYKGSAGGHNGLTSVIQSLHTQEIPRIRIGVGAAPGDMIHHVLTRFQKTELEDMQEAYVLAADAVECAVTLGFETAMNRYNKTESK